MAEPMSGNPEDRPKAQFINADLTPLRLPSRPPNPPVTPRSPTIIPINQSLSNLLVFANARRLTLMQSRLDFHEVELQNLHARIDLQRSLIEQLMHTVLHLRGRMMVAERFAAHLNMLLRLAVLNLRLLRSRLTANAIWRDGAWRVRMGDLGKYKSGIVKMLMSLAACHFVLYMTQSYSIASGALDVLGVWIPERMRHKLKAMGNVALLCCSFYLWREFVGDLASSFPFNLFL